MKLKFLYASVIATFIILIASAVFAATGTVGIKSNIDKVKAGETFIVTLYATSEYGINGIDTKFSYDSEKLELISTELADSLKWSNIGVSPDITVICNSTDSIKSADIYVLKFKVKEEVSVGDILKIETTAILLDTDAQTDSEVSIEAKKVEVEVIGDTTDEPTDPTDEEPGDNPADPTDEKPDDKPADPTDEKPEDNPADPTDDKPDDKPADPTDEKPEDKPADPTDEKPEDKPADPTDQKPEDKPANPTDEKPEDKPANPTEDKPVNPIKDKSEDKTGTPEKNTNANTSKDLTVSNSNLPQTGENTFIIFGLIVVGIVLSIVFGKKYMKYKI